MIAAAHALEKLPRTSEALGSGELHVDKAVELARFATRRPSRASWSGRVVSRAARSDARRTSSHAGRRARRGGGGERSRFFSWWTFDEGRRFGLEAELPSGQGAVVAKMLDRLADSLPVMPEELGPAGADARRADALVALGSSRAGSRSLPSPSDGDRARAPRRTRRRSERVRDTRTARRSAQTRRAGRRAAPGVQTVVEGESGLPVSLGRMTREPAAWMVRHLKYRDGECRFPGCGSRRFTQAHHIVWWEHGGRTGSSRTSCWSAPSITGSSMSTAGMFDVKKTGR